MKIPLPPEIWVEIIKNSPLPESFAVKVKDILAKQAAMPKPPSPEQMKLEIDAKAKQQQLAFEGQKAQSDIQLKQQQAGVEGQLARDQAALELELMREKAAAEIEIQQLKAEANLRAQAAASEQKIQTQDLQSVLKFAAITSGKSPRGIDPESDQKDDANIAGVVAHVVGEMGKLIVKGQQQTAELIAAGNEQVVKAITAPKSMTTPDGRVYTSQTATIQ